MIVLKGHQKNYSITPQAFPGLVDQKSVSLFQGAQPWKWWFSMAFHRAIRWNRWIVRRHMETTVHHSGCEILKTSWDSYWSHNSTLQIMGFKKICLPSTNWWLSASTVCRSYCYIFVCHIFRTFPNISHISPCFPILFPGKHPNREPPRVLSQAPRRQSKLLSCGMQCFGIIVLWFLFLRNLWQFLRAFFSERPVVSGEFQAFGVDI